MSEDVMTEKEMEAFRRCMKLRKKAHEILENGPFNTRVEFTCPLCGGKAFAAKAACNGHVHCSCDTCNINIME